MSRRQRLLADPRANASPWATSLIPNPMSKRCSAATTSGAPCKAWAVRDTDPPLCSTHAGRTHGAGAPYGNQNAVRHRFYSHFFNNQELADMVANLDNVDDIDDEIAIVRVLLARLLPKLESPADLPTAEVAALVPLVLNSTGRIAHLLRDRRALSGQAGDSLLQALGVALDELSTEWNTDL